MKRRHVIAGGLAALSVGTFAAVNELQSPQQGGGDGDGEQRAQPDTGEAGLAGTRIDEAELLQVPVEVTYSPDARAVTDVVRDALAFWEENAQQYAGFDVEYDLVDDGGYLTVRLQETVTSCGSRDELFNGCADRPSDRLPTQLEATVGTALTDQTVFETAVHELGHTLGLGHADEPQRYMSPAQSKPWERERTAVYFEGVDTSDEMLAGLNWLRENAGAVRSEFRESPDRNCGIVVAVGPDLCDDSFVLCSGPGERYTDQVVIQIEPDMDVPIRDWQVTRTVAELADDVPDLLTADTDSAIQRSDWWAD